MYFINRMFMNETIKLLQNSKRVLRADESENEIETFQQCELYI